MANALILLLVALLIPSLSVFIIGFKEYYKNSVRKWFANVVGEPSLKGRLLHGFQF